MASAEIQYPIFGRTVPRSFAAFGRTTAAKIVGLLRDKGDPEILNVGALLVLDKEKRFWAVDFIDVPKGVYHLEIYQSPGLLLARVPDLNVVPEGFAGPVFIQYPNSSQNPIPSEFIAQGTAEPGGTPSGTMTLQAIGSKPIPQVAVLAVGQNWRLQFTVPQSTTLYNLHVDVTNSGGADSKNLCVPPPGKQCQ